MNSFSTTNTANTINRARLIITAIAIIPLVFYLIINNLFLTNSFLYAEKKLFEEKLYNIAGNFETKDKGLDNLARSFVGRYNIVEYINTNGDDKKWYREKIKSPALKYYGIQLILIMDNKGNVIDSAGFKSDNARNDLLKSVFSPILDKTIEYPSDKWSRLAAYNNELYRISACPIYDDGTGKYYGTLLLGMQVTQEYLQDIEKETGWKLFLNTNENILRGDEALDTSKYQKLYEDNNFRENNEGMISILDKNYMMGRIPLKDIRGNRVSYLYTLIPRGTFPDINGLVYRSGLLFFGISLACFLILSIKFKKNIAIPIRKLEKQITRMADNNILEYVNVSGTDEIKNLVSSFNRLAQNLNAQKMENESLKAELENDKIKNEFLTNISHELRTPLNVILGILQLADLNNKNNTDDRKVVDRYGKIIRQNCYRLLRMVNNLIDITKISSHTFRVHLKNNNIVQIIEELVLAVEKFISGKGIHITFNKYLDEKIIACDAEQIERMLLNLISNAIKFMPEGGNIIVGVREEADKLLISIKDNGSGIPENQFNEIFDSFNQVDKSLTRKHEGSGIGLSLVKSIVDLHQGEITVKSKLNEGSEFIVELPVNILPEKNNSLRIINIEQNYSEKINIEFSDLNL